MDVRSVKGDKVDLVVGMWYVGVKVRDDAPMIPADNWHWGCGELGQYVGNGEFYDDDSDEPVDFGGYDYIVEQHMGKIHDQRAEDEHNYNAMIGASLRRA